MISQPLPFSRYHYFGPSIKQTKSYLETLAGLNLKDQVLVTDAGSTKAEIVAQAEKCLQIRMYALWEGHPMAGSHKTGAAAADATLFENAYYILPLPA